MIKYTKKYIQENKGKLDDISASGLNFSHLDLPSASITRSQLTKLDLTGTVFHAGSIDDSHLSGAKGINTKFHEVNILKSFLFNFKLNSGSFFNGLIADVTIQGLECLNFRVGSPRINQKCCLSESLFSNCLFEKIKFSTIKVISNFFAASLLTKVQGEYGEFFHNSFDDCRFHECSFFNIEFKQNEWIDCFFQETAFFHCQFKNHTIANNVAALGTAKFMFCDFCTISIFLPSDRAVLGWTFEYCTFSNADLGGITFFKCFFKNCTFRVSDLSAVIFHQCDIYDTVFEETACLALTLFDSQIKNLSFHRSRLDGALIKACSLEKLYFDNSNLTSIVFKDNSNVIEAVESKYHFDIEF